MWDIRWALSWWVDQGAKVDKLLTIATSWPRTVIDGGTSGWAGKSQKVSNSHRNDVSPLTQGLGLNYGSACDSNWSRMNNGHHRQTNISRVWRTRDWLTSIQSMTTSLSTLLLLSSVVSSVYEDESELDRSDDRSSLMDTGRSFTVNSTS